MSVHCSQNTPAVFAAIELNRSCADPNEGWVDCATEQWDCNVKRQCLILLDNSHSFMFGFFFLWRGELFTCQIHLHANIFYIKYIIECRYLHIKMYFHKRYLVLQILLLFVLQAWENVPLQYPFEEWCYWVYFWAWFFVWKFRCLLFCFWSSSVCVYKCLSGFFKWSFKLSFLPRHESFLLFFPNVMSFIFFSAVMSFSENLHTIAHKRRKAKTQLLQPLQPNTRHFPQFPWCLWESPESAGTSQCSADIPWQSLSAWAPRL